MCGDDVRVELHEHLVAGSPDDAGHLVAAPLVHQQTGSVRSRVNGHVIEVARRGRLDVQRLQLEYHHVAWVGWKRFKTFIYK